MQWVMLEVGWVLQEPARGQHKLAAGPLTAPKTMEIAACQAPDKQDCLATWHGSMLRPYIMLG